MRAISANRRLRAVHNLLGVNNSTKPPKRDPRLICGDASIPVAKRPHVVYEIRDHGAVIYVGSTSQVPRYRLGMHLAAGRQNKRNDKWVTYLANAVDPRLTIRVVSRHRDRASARNAEARQQAKHKAAGVTLYSESIPLPTGGELKSPTTRKKSQWAQYRGPVTVVETGEVFESAHQLAEAWGVCRSQISEVLSGIRATVRGYHLVRSYKEKI
jgi:hypothetical protein